MARRRSRCSNGERPRVGETVERRVFLGDELEQTLAASIEPWTTLFRLASIVGARESELLGLWWCDVDLTDPAAATLRFTTGRPLGRARGAQDGGGQGRAAAAALRRQCAAETQGTLVAHSPSAFVFATSTGRSLSQRNVSAPCTGRRNARAILHGRPTFPELVEHDQDGHVVIERERCVHAAARATPAAAAATRLPRAQARRRDGLRRRRRGARPAPAPELEHDEGDLPRPLRRSPSRGAACPHGSAYGSIYGSSGSQSRP